MDETRVAKRPRARDWSLIFAMRLRDEVEDGENWGRWWWVGFLRRFGQVARCLDCLHSFIYATTNGKGVLRVRNSEEVHIFFNIEVRNRIQYVHIAPGNNDNSTDWLKPIHANKLIHQNNQISAPHHIYRMKNDSLRFQKLLFLFTWSNPRRSSSLTISDSISPGRRLLDSYSAGWRRKEGLPSSRYCGLAYSDRGTTANFIFSNCLPLIPVRLDNLSLVSLKISP